MLGETISPHTVARNPTRTCQNEPEVEPEYSSPSPSPLAGIDPSDLSRRSTDRSRQDAITHSQQLHTASNYIHSHRRSADSARQDAILSAATMKDLSKKLSLDDESEEVSDDGGTIATNFLLSAQKLLAAGEIDETEYEQLVNSDKKFRGETARDEGRRKLRSLYRKFTTICIPGSFHPSQPNPSHQDAVPHRELLRRELGLEEGAAAGCVLRCRLGELLRLHQARKLSLLAIGLCSPVV